MTPVYVMYTVGILMTFKLAIDVSDRKSNNKEKLKMCDLYFVLEIVTNRYETKQRFTRLQYTRSISDAYRYIIAKPNRHCCLI